MIRATHAYPHPSVKEREVCDIGEESSIKRLVSYSCNGEESRRGPYTEMTGNSSELEAPRTGEKGKLFSEGKLLVVEC